MIITIESNELKVGISSFGAELHSVKDKETDTEYLWQADPKFWKRHAPILFPFIGPLKDGVYTVKGKEYKMTSHGFARDKSFVLSKLEDNWAEFILTGEDTMDIYPFDFELHVKYTVDGRNVKTEIAVKNNDCKVMRFYVGGHPAFRCPLTSDEDFTDYVVEFEKPEFIEQPLLKGGKRTILDNADTVHMSHELFNNDVFMKSKPNSSYVTLKSTKSNKGVKLDFSGCDTIAIWSPDNEAEFVCLEPWSSIPSINDEAKELDEKNLAIALEPDDIYRFSFTMQII